MSEEASVVSYSYPVTPGYRYSYTVRELRRYINLIVLAALRSHVPAQRCGVGVGRVDGLCGCAGWVGREAELVLVTHRR